MVGLVNPYALATVGGGGGGGPSDAYGAAVYADSPAAYWRFTDTSVGGTSGSWADSSGNGVTLPNNASNPLLTATTLLAGGTPPAGAASTSGGGRYGLAPNAAWMNTNTFTIEFLVSPNGSNEMFVTRWGADNTTSSWFVWRAGFNLTFAVVSGTIRTSVTSSTSIFNSTTYHVAATLNGGTSMQLFLNGTSVGTGTTGAMNSSTAGLSVGADILGSNSSALVVDEVAFYPTVLSSTRIAAHNALK